MDIILISKIKNRKQAIQSNLYSKLDKLFYWFEEIEQVFKLYVFISQQLIEQQSNLFHFLKNIYDNYQTTIYLIIELDKINHTFITECYEKGLYHIVVLDKENGFKNLVHIQNEMNLNLNYKKKFKFYLWLEKHINTYNYSRIFQYQQSGFKFKKIDFPPFSLDEIHTEPLIKTTIEDELNIQKFSCRLFENSLTVNLDGEIIPCPYYAAIENKINIANILNDLAQDLFIKKGIFVNNINNYKICLLCNSVSRFYWHESKTTKLNYYFYKGKYQQNIYEPLSKENFTDSEFAESDIDQMEYDLINFANSLEHWDNQMNKSEEKDDVIPYKSSKTYHSSASLDMIDIIIPFYESNEKELFYNYCRMSSNYSISNRILYNNFKYQQIFSNPIESCDRFEFFCSSDGPVNGTLNVAFYSDQKKTSPDAIAKKKLHETHFTFEPVSMDLQILKETDKSNYNYMEIVFNAEKKNQNNILLHLLKQNNLDNNYPNILMRLFRKSPNNSSKMLDKCISSILKSGVSEKSIFVINKKQSSSKNRNEGIALCSKPYICFIDDDVEIIYDKTFEILLNKMIDLNSDLIGPRIIDPTGRIFCADPYFNKEMMPIARGLGEFDNGQYNYSCNALWLPTTFLLTKLDVCKAINGFDENYPGSQIEDVDYCLKARLRKFVCYYYGDIAVQHYNFFRNNFFAKNYKYFLNKWSKHKILFNKKGLETLN